MAKRPIFLPVGHAPFWKSVDVNFQWFSGFALSQRQRSIQALHENALAQDICRNPLEVSSKSSSSLGASLSAFHLRLVHHEGADISLESAFQGSKIFSRTGQIESAYQLPPKEAKNLASNINSTDELIGFCWYGQMWPLEPKTWFYDWLFINAVLYSHQKAIEGIRIHDAFTDIEFNPAKSFNCQARSCAIIASTENDNDLRKLVSNPDLLLGAGKPTVNQARLL